MNTTRKVLAMVNIALCGVLALMTLLDAIWPNMNIFLNGVSKLFFLITCLLSAYNALLLIIRQRRRMRGRWRGR